jgi:DNA-binding CsgD family transcriptional regulator
MTIGATLDTTRTWDMSVNPVSTRPDRGGPLWQAPLTMAAPHAPTIRGRDPQLATLAAQIERVSSGAGSVVLIEGAAGMGKSRLIAEGMKMAERLSFPVGVGIAEPTESVAELALLLRALFDGPTPLLTGDARRGLRAEPEQRYWLLQDLQSLLERAAMGTPMLICLDDLQWADSGTIAALRDLPSRLAPLPVGWLLAMRPDQGPAPLRSAVELLAEAGATRIVLEPLDASAVAEIATDLVGAEPDRALLQMADDAGGNPFLLVELLIGLRTEQLVRVDAGRATLTVGRLPDRIRTTMRERLARMSESGRQVATVAASLGRTFSFSNLATMLQLPPASLLSPVGQLIEAGVLQELGDRLSFQHDLTREAVRQASTPSARRALDRQAADVLLSGGALPIEVAAQLASSAEPGDEDAITTLRQAAEALSTLDPGAAADLSRRALELAGRQHRQRGPLVAQTTILLHAAARPEEAKLFADRYLREVLPTAQESEVCLSIASMFALSPDVRAASNRRALALPDLPAPDRARHLARLIYNLIQAGRPDEARALAPETRAACRSAHDANATSIIDVAEAALLYIDGHFERSLEAHETVMRQGFGPGETTRERVAYQWRCELLAVLDRLDESLQLIVDGIGSAQRDRQGWAVDFFETWRGRQLFQSGRLADAAAALEGRFDAEDAEKVVGALYAAGVVALGRVAIHTDDERGKRETARVAKVMFETGTPANRRHGAWLLALAAMADSDPTRARDWILAPASTAGGPTLPLYPMDVTDEPHLVRIALASEDRRLAADAVAAAERRARQNPDVIDVQASAAHARGLLDDDAELLANASELFTRGQRQLALASALEDLGRAQLRQPSPGRGLESLGRSLVVYTDAGATWDARRVRGRLRAHGVRRRLVSSERADKGWAALTESELAVARLVAEGLTNREAAERLFVSPHTVSSHLRHTFTKLDINSRVQLTRLVGEQSPLP